MISTPEQEKKANFIKSINVFFNEVPRTEKDYLSINESLVELLSKVFYNRLSELHGIEKEIK